MNHRLPGRNVVGKQILINRDCRSLKVPEKTLTNTSVKKLNQTLFKLLYKIQTEKHNEKNVLNRKCSHATGVVKSLQGPKVPPCWRKSILQKTPTALTGRLEEFNVAPQPRLQTDR